MIATTRGADKPRPTQRELGERFARLHAGPDAFVIPNPWDVGSARMLEASGFAALATTSAGFAWSLGRLDGQVTLAEKLAHCAALVAAVDVPVNADFENAFADDPREAAANLVAVARAGVVGASIEDFSGRADAPIYEFAHAVERVQAAAEAVHALEFPFTLTARAENLLHGRRDLDDTIRRLQAFEAAGADVLYAPGLATLDDVRTVVGALRKPVNVLGPVLAAGVSVAALADAGVRRVSTGGAIARAALGGLLRAASELREEGGFGWLDSMASGADVRRLLSR